MTQTGSVFHFSLFCSLQSATGRELAFPAMIFDPALAAAARRHQRAKNKAQKSPPDAENTSNNNSTSSSAAPGAVAAEETTSADNINQAPAAAPAAESDDNGGGSAEAKERRVAEKAGSNGGSAGDDGGAGGTGAAGALSLTASSSSSGVDFEGATARVRAGGGASRQRPMKPRVLLKIVVLGCSNVRIVLPLWVTAVGNGLSMYCCCCSSAECLLLLWRSFRFSRLTHVRSPEERLNRTAAGGLPLSRLSARTRPKTALSVVNYVGAVRGGLARGALARARTYLVKEVRSTNKTNLEACCPFHTEYLIFKESRAVLFYCYCR